MKAHLWCLLLAGTLACYACGPDTLDGGEGEGRARRTQRRACCWG